MFSKLQYSFSYYTIFGFDDVKMNKRFNIWRQEETFRQISWISTLTALLYILLSFSNRYAAPEVIHSVIVPYQLFIIPSVLFVISYLASKKKNFILIEFLLLLATLFAATVHTFIVSRLEVYSSYQTELYLMIFWIYTISGLRLIHAIIGSIIISSMAIIGPCFFYPFQEDALIMHTSWVFACMAFGFLGGYLMQESQKNTFKRQLELEELAVTDKLTGLYNRVKLDEILSSELNRAKRYGRVLGLMILDIDLFKEVNDKYGHLIGDKVLVKIAKLIKAHTRSSDIVFRWGGEEFIIICLEVNEQKIRSLAESMRNEIQLLDIEKVDPVTASIGLSLNLKGDNVTSILKRADEALYIAKSTGRNRVELC